MDNTKVGKNPCLVQISGQKIISVDSDLEHKVQLHISILQFFCHRFSVFKRAWQSLAAEFRVLHFDMASQEEWMGSSFPHESST